MMRRHPSKLLPTAPRVILVACLLLGSEGGLLTGWATEDALWVDAQREAGGSDGSSARPYPTIQQGLAAAVPGQTVMVKTGLYREDVRLPSGEPGKPITLAGAPGEQVVISGMDPVTGWEPDGEGRYATDMDWKPEALYVDSAKQRMAREPNEGWWVATEVDAEAKTGVVAIIDPAHLKGFRRDLDHASVYIWTLKGSRFYTCPVVSLDPENGRLAIRTAKKGMPLSRGDRYWIQNQPSLIDEPGEWAVVPAGNRYRISFQPGKASVLSRTQAPRRKRVLTCRGGGYVRVRNLEVSGSAHHGVDIGNAKDVWLSHCVVHNNVSYGVYVRDAKKVVIKNNLVLDNYVGVGFSETRAAVVEGNEIARNGMDGLLITWDSHDIMVRRNYIHDHLLWGHPDNAQIYRGVTGVQFIENLMVAGGQAVMMEETRDGLFRGNMFIGTMANMLIFGHQNTEAYTIQGNTLAFPGYACMHFTGRDYHVTENVFVAGHDARVYGVRGIAGYRGNHNLFWNSPRVTNEAVLASDSGRNNTLAEFVSTTGQDKDSVFADPQFVHAPIGFHVMDGHSLPECTRQRLYLRAPHEVREGDHIEINFDGVVRTVNTVEQDAIQFEPPLARRPVKPWLVANWGDSVDFNMDLQLRPESPAAALAPGGKPAGSPLSIAAYRAGDFDGDGQRDIPAKTSKIW